MKINNLSELNLKISELNLQGASHLKAVENDIDLLKKELTPLSLFSRISEAVIPDAVRHSKLVNGPVNFIAKKIFHEKEDVLSRNSDSGKSSQVRNVALGLLETAASFMVTRYIRKKF